MSTSPRPISDYIEVGRRFRRSINLEKDYRSALQNGDYLITPTALEAIYRFKEGLEKGSPSRAWTITGPYGVGKSAFAVFLTRLLCSTDAHGMAARRHLQETDSGLAKSLADLEICTNGALGLLPILITARRTSAPRCIAEGIVSAITTEKSKKFISLADKLAHELNDAASGHTLDTRWIAGALNLVSQTAKEVGYKGVLVVIDELGKLFEYAARYPQHGDVFVLQELAEHAARSNDFPVILVGLLHQSFEEYGFHLDIATRREWSKIQGRFSDIAFLEPADQVIRMVAEAIRWKSSPRPRGLKSSIEHAAAIAADLGAAPPGMSVEEFRKVATASYPLHPLTLVALPYIFRRFAQNERSLFSYLSSMEPQGFQEFLKMSPMRPKAPEFVRLDDLFDYFTSNFGLGLYRQPQALRWLEAIDVLDRKDMLGELHREVVKTVGVLSALGQFSHLSATASMISLAVHDSANPSAELQAALEGLKDDSVLIFRSYNKSYRIWEGSDVDIDERIAEGERRTKCSFGFADSVRQFVPNRPLVARRHSFETGVLRSFELHYVDAVENLDSVVEANAVLDGKIIVCLAESSGLAEQFSRYAEQAKDEDKVLFAVPQHIGELRGIVTELGSLRWVWENTPELRDDRVARREVSMRITEIEQLLLRHLGGLIDPRSAPIGSSCLWFYTGARQKVSTPADVSQLLSNVFDQIYDKSPRIRNELVVRRSLSSAAAAARRNLIQAMIENTDQPLLGIKGYPPERSIYESVLHATGVHRELVDGRWGFGSPKQGCDHNLYPCWSRLEELVFDRQPEPIPVKELFSELAGAPFGVPDGLHPLLLCAFMLAYRDETTLYREGTFLPEVVTEDFEVLMRRPELFSLAGSRVRGERAAVVRRIARSLNVEPATVPIVRALFSMVKRLPEFAWKTNRLPDSTIALRNAFNNATSPEKFLFVDVPKALGCSPFDEDEDVQTAEEVNNFFAVLNDNLHVWSEITIITQRNARDILLQACGFEAGDVGWNLLREESVRIEPSVTSRKLLDFVRRVVGSSADLEGVNSVLGLLSDRPPELWSDMDVDRFPEVAQVFGRLFKSACKQRFNSETTRGLDRISSKQKRKAKILIECLRSEITKNTDKRTSSELILAVLEELVDEFANQNSELSLK